MVYVKLPVADAWCVRTPRVVRFLEPEYVDAFFQKGELQLSCFEKFSRHTDEARGDGHEGMHVARGSVAGGGVFTSTLLFGAQALVLSLTSNDDAATARELCPECTAGIIINDTTRFGTAVAQCLPDLVRGYEGACIYRETPAPVTMPTFTGEIDPDQLPHILAQVQDQYSHEGYFIKRLKFRSQFEYRLIWTVIDPVTSARVITCPDARQFCSRWADPRIDPFAAPLHSTPV